MKMPNYLSGAKSAMCHKCANAKAGQDRDMGHSVHPLYTRWMGMKQRCCNPNHKDWKHYGEKGVSVCSEWVNDFMAFVDWAKDDWHGLTLDRIDGSKGYSPDNCRWATISEQNSNRTFA